MSSIELWDLRDNVFLTLEDVLSALPPRAERSSWEVSDFVSPDVSVSFFVGGGDNRIETLAYSGRRVDGEELSLLAKTTAQVIWGTFRAFDGEALEPWITIHAIDSTYWRVETEDGAAKQMIMKSFHDVRPRE